MKKHLITWLLSLSFAFTLAGAVACGDKGGNNNTSSESSVSTPDSEESTESTESSEESEDPNAEPCTVTFENGEGYSFSGSVENGGTILSGKTLTFSIDVGAFYTGEPLVYVNGKATSPTSDGTYSVKVTEDVTVTATGVRKDSSMMQGTGTNENPFVVTKPIDLLYIAEQVNNGNRTYQTASFVLANDIDCKGEELEVIGNDPDNNKYFSGCFVSDYNAETGESYRYSISNFTINTEGTNYVGLFGAVFADLSVTSSGLFYGVTLENFEINANMYTSNAESQTIACGSLVGYGVGTTMYLCEASNGEINISGDSGYFSFVGGLIGYQQGYYFTEYGESVPSEISYAKADVDINILSGLVLSAGGISGYLGTNYPFGAIASIHNSYSTGNVTGAIRSGGIAGALGQYTSVNNCYATGLIAANSNQHNSNPLWQDSEYCIAHAGGIVGFAENDTIVHDCYFAGEAEATAITNDEVAIAGENRPNRKYAFASYSVGGGYEGGYVSVDSKKYAEINNVAPDGLDISDKDCWKNVLAWQAYDWVFTANEYPELNYETTSDQVSLTMTLQYVAPDGRAVTVNEQNSVTHTYFNNTIESASFYVPMGNFFATGALDFYYTADNGYLSYGYFFDQACTQPVPYAYMPAKNITLYVAFADPTPIVGEYYYTADNGKVVTLSFNKDGRLTYSDGNSTQTTTYSFDGENVFVDGARLARYYLGNVVVDDTATDVFADANFDLYRYYYYNFAGKLTDDGVTLYDGVYFTEDAPLTAGKTEPQTQAVDAIVDAWVVSAAIDATLTFAADGTWKMVMYGNESNGAYTYADGKYTLSTGNSTFATATLADGVLHLTNTDFNETYQYVRKSAYVGIWKGDNFTLQLYGMGADGTGKALLTYEDESTLDLVYGAAETNGYTAIYIPENGKYGDLFGYFYYDTRTKMLNATLSDTASATGFTACTLMVYDDCYGEWITVSDDFGNAEFIFDGMGLYGQGRVRIVKDGVSTTVNYTLGENASFYYDGKDWSMTFDFINRNIIIWDNTTLERKDQFANVDYVDLDGNRYEFDGKGNLSVGGTLTVNDDVQYTYKRDGDAYGVYTAAGSAYGTIAFVENYVSFTHGSEENKLFVANDFMGDWAISGEFALFHVGPTDTEGVIQANYRGHDVEMTYLDTNLLTFSFAEFSGLPMTYYVFVIDDETTNEKILVLSEYTNLLGDYIVCSRANEMYGTWASNDGRATIKFDGVSSGYQNGIAVLSKKLAGDTYFYYTIKEDGILMWSQDLLQGSTKYFRIDMADLTQNPDALTDGSAFVKDGKAFYRTEVDGLCLTRATDTVTGETYLFDGGCINDGNGGIWCGNEKKYNYTFITYNADSTATLTVIDLATGKTHEATLNYKDSQNITFTLGEEITEA